MKKMRLFEILDKINLDDTKNETNNIIATQNLISVEDKVKLKSTRLQFEINGQMTNEIVKGKKLAIVVLIDEKEYSKYKNK